MSKPLAGSAYFHCRMLHTRLKETGGVVVQRIKLKMSVSECYVNAPVDDN